MALPFDRSLTQSTQRRSTRGRIGVSPLLFHTSNAHRGRATPPPQNGLYNPGNPDYLEPDTDVVTRKNGEAHSWNGRYRNRIQNSPTAAVLVNSKARMPYADEDPDPWLWLGIELPATFETGS